MLVGHPSVAEGAEVGVPNPVKGEVVWAFCRAAAGSAGGAGLEAELSARVVEALGAPFKPEKVVFVDDLPRTRSAKILRRAIRAAVAAEDPGDLSSLENPGALDSIRTAAGR